MGSTIFALASGAGRAAVAVVRISGPATSTALRHLAGTVPQPRVATLRKLRDDATDLDTALVLWFPAPASFTGEDCAELQVHGGRAVVAALLAALGRVPDCRLAEPGEFTRRAFLNGKLDLPAVEGLADLIDAQTEAQRRQALRQLEGALGQWAAVQRTALLRALAAAESAIDFADEGDVAGDFAAEVIEIARRVHAAVGDELARASLGSRIRDGFVVALTGAPNVGKSTLLNALARREVAIVSPHAGTTRDPIEVDLDLSGLLVTLIDTAGLRDTSDPVEREGIARARQRAGAADLVLWLRDTADSAAPVFSNVRLWTVATKADRGVSPHVQGDFVVSADTGQGIPELLAAIRDAASDGLAGEAALVTRSRHARALQESEGILASMLAGGELGIEIMAEQLRSAASVLDSLIGRIEGEEVLGEIFARFCIGK